MPKIKVENIEIGVIRVGNDDYISLTDMVRDVENGSALIEKWLRNKNTIEFLGIWEEMYNPDFNSPEFGEIRPNMTMKWAQLNSVLASKRMAGHMGDRSWPHEESRLAARGIKAARTRNRVPIGEGTLLGRRREASSPVP